MDIDAIVADELLMLRHSGEIPEIALHQSLYFMCKDPEGPLLEHVPEDALKAMKNAVFERYRIIVLRDLKPENRDLSLYRGLARSIMNYRRLVRFCAMESMDITPVSHEAASCLKKFLEQEMDDVKSGRRSSCINCTCRDLNNFALEIDLDPGELPDGLKTICPEKGAYDS